MLLVIIIISDIFCISLPEQDPTREEQLYKNAMKHMKTLLFCYV